MIQRCHECTCDPVGKPYNERCRIARTAPNNFLNNSMGLPGDYPVILRQIRTRKFARRDTLSVPNSRSSHEAAVVQNLVDISDILKIFLLGSGEGFLIEIPGQRPRRGGRGEGPGGCLRGNWEGSKCFFWAPNCHQEDISTAFVVYSQSWIAGTQSHDRRDVEGKALMSPQPSLPASTLQVLHTVLCSSDITKDCKDKQNNICTKWQRRHALFHPFCCISSFSLCWASSAAVFIQPRFGACGPRIRAAKK